jgi:hypothetical protein
MRVILEAYDVDNLPVSFNRAPVEFRFGPQLALDVMPQQWNTGSNEYVAEVSADKTKKSGQYELTVIALNGSSNHGQSMGECTLLHRSITVSPNKARLILAGCLAGAVLLTLGMLAYLLYRKQDALKQALLSFLSFEGLLVLELCFEVWVRASLSAFLVPSSPYLPDGTQTPRLFSATGSRRPGLLLAHYFASGLQAQSMGVQYDCPLHRVLCCGMRSIAAGRDREIPPISP